MTKLHRKKRNYGNARFANKQMALTHHWPHASCLGLVAPTPGDLAPDLVVQLHDVLDRRLVLDLTAGHVVAAGVQVVGTFGTQTLKKTPWFKEI